MIDLIFTPEAEADVTTAKAWYAAVQEELGRAFVEKVDEACLQILAAPNRHAVLKFGIRRVPTKRFPYGIFYVIHDDVIHVIAVVHDRRDPEVWQQRGK
jgi:plasmid stabilization system protein ParE